MKVAREKLDRQQKNTLTLFSSNYNLFLTGSAGTGKSFLVKKMVEQFQSEYPDNPEAMVVTSTTGLSSLNINGRTIHSWSGLTPSQDLDDLEGFLTQTRKNHKRLNNWLYTKVLVIDEISMLDAKILDFLDQSAKRLRNNEEPFGGIQVVLTGDFYQLPPVSRLTGKNIPFSFKAECWNSLIDYTICLTKSHRQEEKDLIRFLNYIRVGEINQFVKEQLQRYHQNLNYDDEYTHLYPNLSDVDGYNQMKLNQLTDPIVTSTAKLISKPNKNSEFNVFPKDSVIVEQLALRKGAFIIINKNIDPLRGLVNGKQGIFQGINSEGQLTIRTREGRYFNLPKARWEFSNFYVEQYPVRLAWALTIHKSQGMGIERLCVDIGHNIFSDGQAYVALSRATNSEYLYIKNYSEGAIKANSEVVEFYREIQERQNQYNKLVSDDGNIYYENVVNGFTSNNLPEDGVVVKDTTSNLSQQAKFRTCLSKYSKQDLIDLLVFLDEKSTDQDIQGLLISMKESKPKEENNGEAKTKIETSDKIPKPINVNLCQVCQQTAFLREYDDWFSEKICQGCCVSNPDYRLMTKTELYAHFKGKVRQKDINNILTESCYKPQKNLVNPRFRPTRLYMLGHIKAMVDKRSRI